MAGTSENQNVFPTLAILKFDNGTERFRFEVTSLTPDKSGGILRREFSPHSFSQSS